MNEEIKETARKLADYSAFKDKNVRNSLYEGIAAAGLGLSLGMLVCMAINLSGIFGKKK